jgi:hypothetical protein
LANLHLIARRANLWVQAKFAGRLRRRTFALVNSLSAQSGIIMLRFASRPAVSNQKSRVHILPALAGLLGLLLIAGCGGSKDPFSYVKVKGKVTYADGSLIPAHRIKLTFNTESPPLDAKTYARPGVAEVNVADGTFDSETSHKAGDGLLPGKHKVQVQTFDKDDRPVPLVPAKYGDPKLTPVEIDTASGNIDIKVEKPKPGEGVAPTGFPPPMRTR